MLADESSHLVLSNRHNIVVISDEAHRSHYGDKAKLNAKTGQYSFGYSKHLRDALPSASFIGFTGTPIAAQDKDTRAVFGDYVSIYDIQDAVDDGATVPIYYESRLAKLDINSADIEALNAEVDEVIEDEEDIASRENSAFATQALQLLPGAMNHILSLQGSSGELDGKKRFLDVMTALSSAYTLCSTLDEVAALKMEIAFLGAVKSAITKFTSVDKRRTDEQKNSALKQIIDNAIVADGVDDIFSLVGLDKPNIGLLSPEFMDDVARLKEKNLAVDLLERLLRDEVKARMKTDVVY